LVEKRKEKGCLAAVKRKEERNRERSEGEEKRKEKEEDLTGEIEEKP